MRVQIVNGAIQLVEDSLLVAGSDVDDSSASNVTANEASSSSPSDDSVDASPGDGSARVNAPGERGPCGVVVRALGEGEGGDDEDCLESEELGIGSAQLRKLLQHRKSQVAESFKDATQWGIGERFDFLKPLGRGSFGAVWAARCKRSTEMVAVKRIDGIFRDLETAKRVLRELWILRRCSHFNVIRMDAICGAMAHEAAGTVPAGASSMCLVFEHCDTDLYKLMKGPARLQLLQVQALAAQLFRGLAYLESLRIVHRDLKPANILVNQDLSLKICDFGLARVLAGQQQPVRLPRRPQNAAARASTPRRLLQNSGSESESAGTSAGARRFRPRASAKKRKTAPAIAAAPAAVSRGARREETAVSALP